MIASLSTRTCPNCGSLFDHDERFTEWCPSCEWNLGGPPPQQGRAARRPARERDRAGRLFARLARHPGARPWTAGRVGAGLLATLVHLVTVGIAVGSVLLVLEGTPVAIMVGVVGIGLIILVRPRLGGGSDARFALARDDAPELYGLADRIATELGVPKPDRLRVEPGFRSGYARVGIRRQTELTIGLALWTALGPGERIALLGRELGHGAARSPRSGLWLRLALAGLDSWCRVLLPGKGDRLMARQFGSEAGLDQVTASFAVVQLRGRAQRAMLDGLANGVLQVLALPVQLLRRCLHRLLEAGSQQAEYRADDFAAQAGSSRAATAMLDLLFLEASAAAHLRKERALVGHGGVPRPKDIAEALWQGLSDYLASVPDTERERRRRIGARLGTAVDGWHPPTHLRIRRQQERPDQPAAVAADSVDWAAVHGELEDSRWHTAVMVLGI
ncbi:M48 family metallopeptidase [Kitasatospora sp. NPDC006697]|uniref:M48 family metallopeptidase n=1 Tax=Kitasatospora sp. NPDC006697 TaxID=3364020 RepID=UPI0036AD3AA9